MANQAAAINRGLRCIQSRMSDQLTFLRSHRESLPDPVNKALGDLENLCVFNKRLSTAMSRTMRDLSEGSFLMLSNFTLLRRDSFLDYIRPGVKTDTLQDLRCYPFHMDTLFSDLALAQAEKEVSQFEDRRPQGQQSRSQQGSKPQSQGAQGQRYHPYQGKQKAKPSPKAQDDSGSWKSQDKPRSQSSSSAASRPKSYV